MSTGVTAPLGFRAAAVASGIKPDRLDLALLVADAPCTAAAVFTSNLAQAAPVLVSREHVQGGRARAVVVNAGCANAGTGEGGLADARETARGMTGSWRPAARNTGSPHSGRRDWLWPRDAGTKPTTPATPRTRPGRAIATASAAAAP